MKIGRLLLLGAFVLGASATAEAATTVPKLHAAKAATTVALDKEKKKAHSHKATNKKVAHAPKTKKVKKAKKS